MALRIHQKQSISSSSDIFTILNRIQKSSNPIETIKVYDQYKEEGMKNDQFIAITLRILTRSIRIGENDDPEAVKGFFERNLSRVKKINVKTLSVQYIKDIIIFYVCFYQHFQLKKQQIQILNGYLQQFLIRFNHTSNQAEIQLYSVVIFLSIPLTHKYSQVYNQHYLKIILLLLQNNSSKYTVDHEDFQKLLQIFSTFQNLNNPIHKQITFIIFSKLKELNVTQNFTQKRITAILDCILNIKCKTLDVQQIVKLIDQVYNKTEQAFLNIFSIVKMYTFSRIIPKLLELRPQSPILSSFYKIISDSITQQFKCKIDLRVVVMGISFLSQQHFFTYFSNRWTLKFVKMVEYYHKRNDLFFDGIIQKLYTIINQRIIGENFSYQLYRVIFEKINQSENRQNKKVVKKLIMSSIMHAKHGRLIEAKQNLIKANKHFRVDKKQINNSSFNSNKVDLFSYYNKICNYQQNQKPVLSDFIGKEIVSIKPMKYKFVTELLCLLFTLKINLAYANLSYIEVENTLKNSEIAQVRYIYNRQRVCKTVIFDTRFSEVHFSNAIQLLIQLYGNSINLQLNLSRFIKRKIQLYQQINKDALGLIFFFYSRYHSQQLIELLIKHQELLKKSLKKRFDDILRLILQISNRPLIREHCILILSKAIKFCTLELQKTTALNMFIQISKCLQSIIANKLYFEQIFNLLKDCSFNHLIFDQEIVNKVMNSLAKQLYLSQQKWHQSKQKFLLNLQPDLLQLYQNIFITPNSSSNAVNLFQEKLIQLKQMKNFSLLKNYLTLLYILSRKQKIHSISHILLRLKQIALKVGSQPSFISQFFRFMIKNKIFFSQLGKPFFDIQICESYGNHYNYLKQISQLPIQKSDCLLYSLNQQIALNPIENITSFCLIYSFISHPSLEMRQFMAKLCLKYKKNIPYFFKLYLSQTDTEVNDLIQTKQATNFEDLLSINFKVQNKVIVNQFLIKPIFERDKISTSNWWDINRNKIQEGVHLLIIRKLLQKKYPDKQIQFELQKGIFSLNNS